jgi:hypothetical protein
MTKEIIEKIQKEFDVMGVCSVPLLMKRYRFTREKASEILDELKGVHRKYFSGDNETLWRVLNYTYSRFMEVKESVRAKKTHDFENTDQEWAHILKIREENGAH